MPPITPSQNSGSPIDAQALTLAKTIKRLETGTKSDAYTAKGASGEFGAFQFMPDTYKRYAQKYLGNADAEPSVENQNKIAYSYVKEKKDSGWNPAQILAGWNAGEAERDAYKGTFSNGQPAEGTNSKGVKYSVPTYVKRGSEIYRSMAPQSSNTGYRTEPSLPAPTGEPVKQDDAANLAESLSGRLKEGAGALTSAYEGATTGDLGKTGSGLLQAAGAGAGAVGDVIQSGLELIPGVKKVEEGLGKVIGAAADTPIGKQVVGLASQFAQEHPEAAKDLNAVVNIASVIPMFKAVGVIANTAKTATAKAFAGTLEKAATKEIQGIASNTIAGRNTLERAAARGLDPTKTLLESKALPEVVDGRYNASKAWSSLTTQPEEDQLQYLLKSAPATKGGQWSLAESRKNALKEVGKEFENRTDYEDALSEVNKIFDSYESRFGETVALDKVNALKRGVRDSVNFNSPKLQSDIHYIVGQSLMDDVQTGAQRLGLDAIAKQIGTKDVASLNKAMANKIEARKLLKLMNGKKATASNLSKWWQEIGADVTGGLIGAGTEALTGGITGGLGAGLAGRYATKSALKSLYKSPIERLGASRKGLMPSRLETSALGAGLLRGSSQKSEK